MKKVLIIILCLLFVLVSCKERAQQVPNIDNVSSDVGSSSETDLELSMPDISDVFTDRDLESTIPSATANIVFTNTGVTSDTSIVSIDGTTCTIIEEGVYVFSGTCSNGRIIINADKKAKIQLVLDGLDLTGSTSSVIFAKAAKKLFITIPDGTENSISNTSNAIQNENDDAVIFSRCNTTINGTGILNVTSKTTHGIVSKDSLSLVDTTLNIESTKCCLNAKDSLNITNVNCSLVAGSDAIRSENTEEVDMGIVRIYDGKITIVSEGDGIFASLLVLISNGDFDVQAASDSLKATQANMSRDKSFDSASTDSTSKKAIKSNGSILIENGSFVIISADDAIHANDTVKIAGGSFDIQTGDDAVHATNMITIDDCTLNISTCVEGIEAICIEINGGTIDIVASDDGINAYSTDTRPGSVSSTSVITINGGSITIIANGDGLDSNGSIEMNGGEVYISASERGADSALDYDSHGYIHGGTAILCGTSEMALNFGQQSTQVSFLCNMSTVSGNTRITCADNDGNVIASFVPQHSFSSIVVSSPKLELNTEYTLFKNGTIENGILIDGESLGTVTLTKTVSTFGNKRK